MAEVYRLPAAPGWNTWRTNAGFFVSTVLLGIAAMLPILAYEASLTGIQISSTQWSATALTIAVFLLFQLGILMHKALTLTPLHKTRVGLMLMGMTLAVIVAFRAETFIVMLGILMSLCVISEEVLGRWSFYRSRL
jgi:DMSO reductase anchor subunit